MRCLPGYGYGLTFLFLVCPKIEKSVNFVLKCCSYALLLPLLLLTEHRSQ